MIVTYRDSTCDFNREATHEDFIWDFDGDERIRRKVLYFSKKRRRHEGREPKMSRYLCKKEITDCSCFNVKGFNTNELF